MIPLCSIGESRLPTTRLAFGTARLHHVAGGPARQRLLQAAVDQGIVHFDTAPCYGDGLAEAEIGRLIAGARDRFVVATKFGIPERRVWIETPLAYRLSHAWNAGLARLRLRRPRPLPPITPADLRASLQRSLRRLRTDYVDILFLHEPAAERVPDVEALVDALVRLRQSGLIRDFGLAGAFGPAMGLAELRPALASIVQTHDGEWDAATARPPEITFGSISPGPQSLRLPGAGVADAVSRVRHALARRPGGVVLISSTSAAHVRELAAGAFRAP